MSFFRKMFGNANDPASLVPAGHEQKRLRDIAYATAIHWVSQPYYEEAEAYTSFFWDAGHHFRRMFDQIDSSVIIDLACGRGRHTEVMKGWSNTKILVDVNQVNIDACKKRFAEVSNVQFILNNGIDLQPIPSASVTGIFCYDAMVHFDFEVIYSYLRDSSRVLVPGGRAVFHHSNYSSNPSPDYVRNPHVRNFMSASLFAHLALKCGFQVLEQKTLDWGDDKELDCLTLLAKPS